MTPEQLRECPIDQCAENTDREIYRGPDDGCGDFYADSLHITQEGALGIDCGGYVVVKPIRTWHGLAKAHAAALEELARLRARLEIDFATDGNGKRVPFPTGGPDGIACRDETIRILESALAEAERKCARVKGHAENIDAEAIAWAIGKLAAFGVGNVRAESAMFLDRLQSTLTDIASYRAEFKEE